MRMARSLRSLTDSPCSASIYVPLDFNYVPYALPAVLIHKHVEVLIGIGYHRADAAVRGEAAMLHLHVREARGRIADLLEDRGQNHNVFHGRMLQ